MANKVARHKVLILNSGQTWVKFNIYFTWQVSLPSPPAQSMPGNNCIQKLSSRILQILGFISYAGFLLAKNYRAVIRNCVFPHFSAFLNTIISAQLSCLSRDYRDYCIVARAIIEVKMSYYIIGISCSNFANNKS